MRAYGFDERPDTQFTKDPATLFNDLSRRRYVCLIGPNNSGKSYVLQRLTQHLGGKGVYLGPSRYSNFNTLAPYKPETRKKKRRFQEFIQQFQSMPHNIDKSPFNIQQAIAELGDNERSKLFEIVKIVVGVTLELALVV